MCATKWTRLPSLESIPPELRSRCTFIRVEFQSNNISYSKHYFTFNRRVSRAKKRGEEGTRKVYPRPTGRAPRDDQNHSMVWNRFASSLP